MTLRLEDIKAPIAKEMDEFEHKFRESMKTRVMLLDRIMNYIVKRKGKQMRPMFVFLSAGTCGTINESTFRGAALIELLHTATLVHDDVVDEANYRRGFFSINALWKNKVAVLVGDFLLSKGLLLSVENQDFKLLKIVSDAVREMSEGELLQIQRTRTLNITEEEYFSVIEKKTASLIAACTAAGAASAGASPETIALLKEIGKNTGIAFQIQDDLFDYMPKGLIGKPTGNDLQEKKFTLPLIYALKQSSAAEHAHIKKLLATTKKTGHQVTQIVEFVTQKGGLHYARQTMQSYCQKAINGLHTFEPGPVRNALEELIRFTTERNN
jgi:octaprenyl-diphosphate synthase